MTLFCHYRDVLGDDANRSVLAAALRHAAHFERSRVAPRRIDPHVRMSTVVYEDRLSDVAPLVRAAVECRLDEVLAELGIEPFERAGMEVQLTSHNEGEFFGRHTDSCSPATASRTLSFVYYVNREPKVYEGGELVLFGPDGHAEVVDPRNDSLVLFDPRTPHEVRPVTCPSGRFEDGRFTLNGWVHRRVGAVRGFAFDERIFRPVGSWPGAPLRPTPRARRDPTWTADEGRRDTPAPGEDVAGMRALLLLYGDLHRTAGHPDAIDVRPAITGRDFFVEHYSRNRPVLVPGLFAGSGAVATWSPERFATQFGTAVVEITSGRERHPEYEVRYRETLETTTMADLVRRVTSVDESNDVYLVARNDFFDRAAFAPLRDELRPPPDIIDVADRRSGTMKMWFGPKGTVTPLHFDEHSILFVQVHGRKWFKLIPSFERPRMYVRDRYYSEVDPTDVDLARHPLFGSVSVLDVEVGPGDALFLPAGWWHWARSLSVSMSVTFSSFAIPGGNTVLGRSTPR